MPASCQFPGSRPGLTRAWWVVLFLLVPDSRNCRGADDPPATRARLNQIQVIGSHNSYHIAPAPGVRALIAAAGENQARGLDYTHPPLAEQFSAQAIRQIELDLFHDPEGGRYARPAAPVLARKAGRDPGPDPNKDEVLSRPGTKILHVPDVDYLTTAPTLVAALRQVRLWSQANPRHVPILILLELKSSGTPGLPTRPLPFDRVALETIEREILSVFDRKEILTPDDVRGSFATLPEAIRRQGWPRLQEVLGKVFFALDNEDEVRDIYLEGHPSLQGRLLFASVPESSPAAAWFKINDAIKDFNRIQRLVAGGYLVRTRADADTREARANDTSRRDRALASGAQFISTDYAAPDPRLSPYRVQLAGGKVARTNPVSGDRAWDAIDLEPASTPAAQVDVQRAVLAMLARQEADWNKGDLDGFMTGYWNSPRLVFQSGGTRTEGWQATLDRYVKRYRSEGKAMGTLAFSGLQIEPLSADAAFARGGWRLTLPGGQKLGGLFTLILRRFPGGWKIVHDHTSAEP